MDKNKNRTDMLAAGRKKLQQFRKKKDQKGSNSAHVKFSGKASKAENDGDTEEPAKLAESQPLIDADVPSTSQSGPSVTLEPVYTPSVPSIEDMGDNCFFKSSGAMQEANYSGSQERNVVTHENRKDEPDGSTYEMVPESEGMLKDLASAPRSEVEVAQERDQSSFLSKGRDNITGLPSNFDNVGKESDWMRTSSDDLEARSGTVEENAALTQEASDALFSAEGSLDVDPNFSDTTEDRTSLEESVEAPFSSSKFLSTDGEDGAVIDDAEGEISSEETSLNLISGRMSTQEESGSRTLDEEVKVSGAHLSYKVEDSSIHEEGSAELHLSHNLVAAEGEDDTVVADQEGDRRNGEKDMLESGRIQEANDPLIPDKVLVEEDSNLSYMHVGTDIKETLKPMSSSPEAIPAIKREDDVVVTNVDGVEYIHQARRSQDVNRCSIPDEQLLKANISHSEEQVEPERTSYVEENPETVASSSENSLAFKEENGAIIAGTLEEIRALEDTVQQLPLVDDATVESVEKLLEPGFESSGEMVRGMNKEYFQLGSSNSEADSIKHLLYLTIIERGVLQFQLDEQTALNAEYQQNTFYEASKLRDLVKETQDTKAVVDKELKQCMSELQAMTIAKEAFETQWLSTEDETEELQIKTRELQTKLGEYQEGLSHALVELADCRVLLENIQKENLDLTESLNSEKDAKKELTKENEFLVSENTKLTYEILEQKDHLSCALDKQVEVESNLRETGACFEQLADENLYLAVSLEVNKAKLEELDIRHLELSYQPKESGNRGMHHLILDTEEDPGNTVLFGFLKQHLGDAINFLHNLEKSVDAMHSHNVSLTRSGGRVAAPGISKIIQAFESKAQHMGNVADEMPVLIDGGHAEDLYTVTKEQTHSLRDVLKQIDFELVKAEVHLTKEQNGREHSQKISEESKTQNQQCCLLQERIDELVNNAFDYKSKILDLQNHIDEMQQNADEENVMLVGQVERLQKQVNEREFIFKQEDNSLRAVIFDAIEKLNAFTGLKLDDGLYIGSQIVASVDAAVLAIKSLHGKVDAAHLNYDTLLTSFEELHKSLVDIQGRNTLAFELLKKMYLSLSEFVNDSYQGESLIDVSAEESLQILSGNCDLLIEHLQRLVDERHYLLLTNNELEVGLSNINHEFEELSMRCDSLAKKLEDECRMKEELELTLMNNDKIVKDVNRKVLSLVQKLEAHELSKDFDAGSVIMKSDNSESEFYKSTLLHLEALVDFHLQRHEEAIEQLISSKTYLQDSNIVTVSADSWYLPLDALIRQELVPNMSELKDKQQLLSASNLQQEAEIRTLNDRLSKMKEAMEASHAELNLKVSELEQSEQRLSSVREKLSIAVAKGKGLIVQRDSLKQSLVEKSSELENCLHELHSKEALLYEVEAKLKSCSEVDRVEALESELSYIRNSATALRDSFLLKDSVLQRIEEVLEDLELPEHFHSKDIVEKIELLSKLVAGNSSFPMSDWDQKSSEGHSHSDAGNVIMDEWKDDVHPSSNPEFDELKRKFEEIQSKFYGVAEHNDMLEQSLLERNALIQKWEEMLDIIDMPSHLRTLEPEDMIKNLGRALSEIQQERDALQRKIENLEVSSDMLISDLEEAHKKISELSAEVVTIKSEKDFFFESLENLRFQYLSLSEKTAHDEVEGENLRRELAVLQEKLVEKSEEKVHHDIDVENEMQKLHDLVLNALPDSEKFETVSHGSDISSLESLVRKLIDNYTVLSLNNSKLLCHKDVHSEESNISSDKHIPEDVMQCKDQELSGLRLELDQTSQSLVSAEEERDEAMLNCKSLTQEIEEITRQMNLLQEQRNQDMEKHQSLVLELEAICKSRDALQEQLSQEEQKSAAAREKLNVAVRKGKGLVQQRDSLKQTIEEMNSTMERLNLEHNQQVEAIESERSSLMNQLAVSKQKLHEYSQDFNRLLATVHSIDIGTEVNIVDPVRKLEEIGKVSRHLHSAVGSSQNEAKKSKQAADLLLVELNEVHDRVDILQENLANAEAALAESYKQKHDAEAAKAEALSHLEHFMSVHYGERKKQIDNLLKLKDSIDQLRKGCVGGFSLLSDVVRRDGELFSYMQTFFESILKQLNGGNIADLPVLVGSSNLHNINPVSEENSNDVGDAWQLGTNSHLGDELIAEHFAHACSILHNCTMDYNNMKDKLHQYLSSVDQHESYLSETLETVQRKLASQKEYLELLMREVSSLESVINEKDIEICSMRRNVSLLYEVCNRSILEIENRKPQIVGSSFSPEVHISENSRRTMPLPSKSEGEEHADGHILPLRDQSIRMMADSLLSAIQSATNISGTAEGDQRELKATILELQRELQEKDIEMKRISEELVSQIRDAEAIAKRSSADHDSTRSHAANLEKKLAGMENDNQLLHSKISMLKDCEASLNELEDRVKSLTDTVAAKDQEIEGLKSGLMQALDEEESKMEALENRNAELEDIIQEKILALEKLEASRAKAFTKLSTTVSKFDELHNLSESLLAEIESLESQIRERDSEISFLRQEVTRCTNHDLASQETNKKYVSEINEVLTWMEMMVSRFGEPHIDKNDQNFSQIRVYTDIINKRILSIMNELDAVRLTAQSKDALLQVERGRMEELLRRSEDLKSVHGKESQREPFQGDRDSTHPSSSNSSGSVEIEQMVQRNKVSSAPAMTHIRSGRKVNNDQVSIAIDVEKGDNVLDDEDDDKAHGFKSLTMSRLVPRATRPISDRIDGIWVSADRLLMRQPSLRLGVIVYWILLHALLASII